MDNLPNLQSVGKFIDSCKNLQKEQKKVTKSDNYSVDNKKHIQKGVIVMETINKTLPTTTTTNYNKEAIRFTTTATTTITSTSAITSTTTITSTISKSTGAIKKQTSIHDNASTSTANPVSMSNNRLRFFQRSGLTKNPDKTVENIHENSKLIKKPQQQTKPTTANKTVRNEQTLVERFRRLQLNKNNNNNNNHNTDNQQHHSLELQPSVELIDPPLNTISSSSAPAPAPAAAAEHTIETATRPAHIALKQLRSLDAGTACHMSNCDGFIASGSSSSSIFALTCSGSTDEPTPPDFAYQHLGGSSIATTNSNTSLESCSYVDFADTTTTTTTITTAAITFTTTTTATKTQNSRNTSALVTTAGASGSVCYWAWQQTIATVAASTPKSNTLENNNYTIPTSFMSTNNNNNTNNSNSNDNNLSIEIKPKSTTSIFTMDNELSNSTTTTAITTPTTSAFFKTITSTENLGKKDTRRGRRSPLLKMSVIKQLSSSQPHPPCGSAVDEQLEVEPTTTTIKSNSSSKTPSRSGSASKLMSFLFKSSNESNKSLQGQSNEGFTESTQSSSFGEWEYLGRTASAERFEIENLPEEEQQRQQQQNTLLSDEAGSYFQYTLSSPSNPFIPEIVAHSYHNQSEVINKPKPENIDLELQLSSNSGSIMHARSQLPTPIYSRAGSQESTHSDGAAATFGDNVSSCASSSLVAGRQRRKLYSSQSPRFSQHQSESGGSYFKMMATTTPPTNTTTTTTTTSTTTLTDQKSFMRNLNPFVSSRRASSHGASPKRSGASQQLSSTVSTPSTTLPMSIQAKREEFLRATMKICLVVSPPSNKLQIKSKSLTHLDRLGPTFTCNQNHNHYDDNDNDNDNDDSEGRKQQSVGQAALLQNYVGVANSTTTAITAALTPGILNHRDSGTEYFQINFCLDPNATEDYELIPVKKGMKLSISRVFKDIVFKREHNTNRIDFMADNTVQSLDKNTCVERLTGHHLIVTHRDSVRKTTLQKAASFGARSRPAKLLSSVSTEETSEPVQSTNTGTYTTGSASVGRVKQRWSGLFGIKNAQYVQFCEILNAFSRSGVPQQPETILYLDHPNFADAMQYLSNMHTSWTDFVNCENMNDNDKRIQTAIWELVTTEVFYIQTLQTVTNLFLACLLAVKDQHILNEIDQNKLFSNVREICFANLRFWTMSLYPMVAHSVATSEPMRIVFFQQGFASFGALFAPYKRYCAEQSTCQYYCKELYRSNVLFTSYLAWCESHKMCNRLRLADILVRPMQRLTKYSLLLSAIRKQLYNIQEVELLDYMIQSVENFVCSVNSHLTIRQEHERLKGVMARIESYDVVPETNNEQLDRMLRQFSHMFDLCMPMKGCPAHHVRHLFMEGDHKYKDNTGKIDVHCFLMTDMLIVCKAMSKKSVGQLKVIRQPYITDRLVVHLQNNVLSCVYLNEYQVAVSAFTLTSLEARSWYDSLKRARNIYTRLKQSVHNLTATSATHLGASGSTITTASAGSYMGMADFTPYTNAFETNNYTVSYSASNAGMGTEGIHASSGNLDGNLDVTATDPLSLIMRKSPMSSSSVCSHISSTNASKSGSAEWNESRNISVEMEKTNSLSSDDGAIAATAAGAHSVMAALIKGKNLLTGHKNKLTLSTTATATTTTATTSNANRLTVQQPFISHLGQSLPNLTTHQSQTSSSSISNLYHTYSNNTLLVPSTTSTHSGNLLLSPSHRGISYPPPSPSRVPLRRGLAFSTPTKNPPLVKTRNITSQNSFSWRQMFSPSVVPVPQTSQTIIPTTTKTTPPTTNNVTSPPSPKQSEHCHNFQLAFNMGSSLDTQMDFVTSGLTGDSISSYATQSMPPAQQTTPLLLTTDDIAEETAEHLMQYSK